MRSSSTIFIHYFTLVSSVIPVLQSAVQNSDSDLLKELSGTHLLMTAHHDPPLGTITKHENGTFTYVGTLVEAGKYLAEAVNATLSFVMVKDEEVKRVGNKEATILLLMRDEVNVTIFGMAQNIDHCKRMDCAVPYAHVPTGLIVPWPEAENRVYTVFRPFKTTVWISVLATMIAVIVALVYLPAAHAKLITKQTSGHQQSDTSSCNINYTKISDAAAYVFTILTNHGNFPSLRQSSVRLAVAGWCLGVFVILNAYSGTLLSAIIVPQLEPVPKSLEDIAYGRPNNKLKLITELNQVLAKHMEKGTSPSYKVLGDIARANPELYFTTKERRLELMWTGKYAYSAVSLVLYPFLESLNKKAGYCKFTISTHRYDLIVTTLVFTFKKNWRYTSVVNSKLQWWWEFGLTSHWIKMFQPKVDQCQLENYRDDKAGLRSLALSDLYGAFFVLFIGTGLSFLFFLFERFSSKCFRRVTSENVERKQEKQNV